ncbi:AAA family ATPase [Ramlibacter terrae]|uniref:AAA family ATPase n=1 Tax=Ramlibacter terrae TaxID=2732511 RepID=A0ABX6P665_9BURK|nr:AAA family ATPase [Ramlibacter terrae]
MLRLASPQSTRWQRQGQGRFVGRQQEFALLKGDWFMARANRRGLYRCLVGEPGIGKTRLLQEFEREVRGDGGPVTVVNATGHRDMQSSAFAALSLAFEGSGLRELAAPLRAAPDGRARRRAPALVAGCIALAQRAPLCFIVDDAQWLDPSTIDFIDRLRQAATAVPLLLLVSLREEARGLVRGLDTQHATQLSALDTQESLALIGALSGGAPLSPEVRSFIAGRAAGIPLFLEETVRMVGQLESEPSALVLGIPSTLEDLLTARLDALGPAKPMAQLAAVIGAEFPIGLWDELLSDGDEWIRRARTPEAWQKLVDAGVLVVLPSELPRCRFRHALIRDAAYESLWSRDRKHLHAVVARVLEKAMRCMAAPRCARTTGGRWRDRSGFQRVDARRARGRRGRRRPRSPGAVRARTGAAARAAAGPDAPPAGPAAAPAASRALDRAGRVWRGERRSGLPAGRGAVHRRRSRHAHAHRPRAGGLLCDARRPRPRAVARRSGGAGRALGRQSAPGPASPVGLGQRGVPPGATSWPRSPWASSAWRATSRRCTTPAWCRTRPSCSFATAPGARSSKATLPRRGCASGARWIFRWRSTTPSARRWRTVSPPAWRCSAATMRKDSRMPRKPCAAAAPRRSRARLAHAQVMRGRLRAALGDTKAGLADMEEGVSLWMATGARITVATYLALQAEVWLELGRPEVALQKIRLAQETARRHGERYYEAELVRLRGWSEWQVRGSEAEARSAQALLQQSLDLATAQRNLGLAVRGALALGRTRAEEGDIGRAAELVATAVGAVPAHENTADVRAARAVHHAWVGSDEEQASKRG